MYLVLIPKDLKGYITDWSVENIKPPYRMLLNVSVLTKKKMNKNTINI